jgi:hypothetical protein
MNMIGGDIALASLKSYLILAAPTPTYISTKSEPDAKKKGTPASPAQAFARSVLPVPGGPVNNAPLGILAPTSLYFCGYFRKSTNYSISSLLSFSPATSLNLILISLTI